MVFSKLFIISALFFYAFAAPVAPALFVHRGQRCNPLLRIFCVPGQSLGCYGTPGKTFCKTVVEVGGLCADPLSTCRIGFPCVGVGNHKTCQLPFTVVRFGQRCNPLRNIICHRGTSCSGTPGNTFCKKIMDVGGLCADPLWVCNRGLFCIPSGHVKICRAG